MSIALLGVILAVSALGFLSVPAVHPVWAAAPVPAPTGYLVDSAHLLPNTAARQIEGELASFDERTQHQLAVVTVPDLGGADVDGYARSLFDRWGIGRAGIDDGGLLLVAVHEREVRIQVGAGLRALGLSDDRAVDIVNAITPALHRNDFAAGLLAGERAMRRAVGDTVLEQQSARVARFGGGRAIAADPDKHVPTKPWVVALTFTLLGGIVVGLIVVVLRTIGAGGPGGGSPSSASYVSGISGAAGSAGAGGGAVGGGGGATGGF